MELTLFLLFLNVAIPIWLAGKSCVNRNGIEFNHILTFTIGHLFYWIFPVIAGTIRVVQDAPGMQLYYGVYDQLPPGVIPIYLARCLLFYLAFYGGAWACQQVTPIPKVAFRPIFFKIPLLHIYFGLFTLIACAYGWVVRGELFQGYYGNVGDIGPRGSFTAASVYLLMIALIYNTKRAEQSGDKLTFRQFVVNPYFLTYLFFAILVLSMGGRLYFLSSVLMLFVYRSLYMKRLKLRTTLQVGGGMLAVASLLGLARFGSGLSGGDLLVNIFSESLFGSLSLFAFLAHEPNLALFNAPIFLANDFLNLVPSVLMPNKADSLLNPADYGYTIYAPLGGFNSFCSWTINFGIVGTMLALFAFSYGMQVLKIRRDLQLARVIYVMIAGWTATTLFRDAFFISFVKLIFQSSILIPVLVVVSLHLLSLAMQPPAEPTRPALSE